MAKCWRLSEEHSEAANPRRAQSGRGGEAHYCAIYLQEVGQVRLVSEKKALRLPAGGRKRNQCEKHLEKKKKKKKAPEHSHLPKEACPQGQLVNQSLTCWGVPRSLAHLEEGKTRLQPSCSIKTQGTECGEELRNTWEETEA